MTLFIALLSLDFRRKYANRVDIICCIKMPSVYEIEQNSEMEGSEHVQSEQKTIFESFFKNYYIPIKKKKPMKIIILGLVCTIIILACTHWSDPLCHELAHIFAPLLYAYVCEVDHSYK